MSLMPSLCAALERVGGERLVMRAGERPHVLAGDRRHDVASAILSVNAVEALAEQILSSDGRRELREKGTTSETIQSGSFPHPLMAKAERVGDEFSIELVVQKAIEESAPSEPEPVAADVAPVLPEPEPEPVAIAPPPPPVIEHFHSEPAPVHVEAPRPIVQSEPVSHPPVTVVTRVEEHRPVMHAMRTLSSPAAGERFDLQGWIAHAIGRGATTLLPSRRCPGLSAYRRSHRAPRRRCRRRSGARRSVSRLLPRWRRPLAVTLGRRMGARASRSGKRQLPDVLRPSRVRTRSADAAACVAATAQAYPATSAHCV